MLGDADEGIADSAVVNNETVRDAGSKNLLSGFIGSQLSNAGPTLLLVSKQRAAALGVYSGTNVITVGDVSSAHR